MRPYNSPIKFRFRLPCTRPRCNSRSHFNFALPMKTKTKVAAALALLIAAALASVVSPTIFESDTGRNDRAIAATAGSDWMKNLDSERRISQFSLPGTHNSAALFEPIRGTARCQNLTIPAQLNAGVRFLDIRCRHANDAFEIYHGPIYQKDDFAGVVTYVADFLRAHPSETVILSVQETDGARDNTRSFEATFADYLANTPAPWLLDATIPTLNRARGKIVLLRRFDSAKPLGIDASNWPDNSTFTQANLRVQDQYQVSDNADKWRAIESLLNQTRDDAATPSASPLILNFASGVTPLLGVPNVPRVANAINPQLTRFFSDNPRGRFGCVLVDFADAELCAAIYRTNGI